LPAAAATCGTGAWACRRNDRGPSRDHRRAQISAGCRKRQIDSNYPAGCCPTDGSSSADTKSSHAFVVAQCAQSAMGSVIQIGEIGADFDAQLMSVDGRSGDEGM